MSLTSTPSSSLPVSLSRSHGYGCQSPKIFYSLQVYTYALFYRSQMVAHCTVSQHLVFFFPLASCLGNTSVSNHGQGCSSKIFRQQFSSSPRSAEGQSTPRPSQPPCTRPCLLSDACSSQASQQRETPFHSQDHQGVVPDTSFKGLGKRRYPPRHKDPLSYTELASGPPLPVSISSWTCCLEPYPEVRLPGFLMGTGPALTVVGGSLILV